MALYRSSGSVCAREHFLTHTELTPPPHLLQGTLFKCAPLQLQCMQVSNSVSVKQTHRIELVI